MDEQIALIEKIKKRILQEDNSEKIYTIILNEICTTSSLPFGEVWLPDENKVYLKNFVVWDDGNYRLEKFKNFTSLCKFAKGIGLIGKVWQNKKPMWMDDLTSAPDFLRNETAVKCGLKAGFAVPVINGNEVTSVLAFFVSESRMKNKELSDRIFMLASLIGELLKERMD